VVIAALVTAVLLAVYGATGLWGAATASIGAVMLLAACVLAEAERARQLTRRLGDLSGNLDGRVDAVDGRVDALKESHKMLADDMAALRSDDIGPLRKADIGFLRRLGDLSSDIEKGLGLAKEAHKALSDDVGSLRGEEYIGFSRRLGPEAEADLCSVWSERLGVVLERSYIRYLERKVLQIEGVCAGRVASDMHDALLRAVVARSVPGDEFNGIEIGVLFGISAMVILEAVGPFFEHAHMTLIDPFEGYYQPDELDPMTRLPVSRRLVDRNLDRFGVSPEQYTVIQGCSGDDRVSEQVSGRTYNFLLIDGDHSFEGVKADFDRYAPRIQPGGFVVLDDYSAPQWPGVTRFVDEVLSVSPLVECVGMASRTAVFRRT